MKCPDCGLDNSEVICTKQNKEVYTITRIRRCNSCGNNFKTIEFIAKAKRGTRKYARII